jgi:telomeric repeat-binding factor 2-interacting protein 1
LTNPASTSNQQRKPSVQEVPQNLNDTENVDRTEEEGAMLFMELPFLPSSPEPADESFDEKNDDRGSESGDTDLISWVEAQVSRGFDDAVIDDALCCTSLNCELAGKILNILAAGKPIPNDIRGVWTSKDDEDLQGSNGREVERVLKKHGEYSLSERWTYLSEARERDMI